MMVTSVTSSPDFQASAPRVVFEANGYENMFAVSSDGRQFLERFIPDRSLDPEMVLLIICLLPVERDCPRAPICFCGELVWDLGQRGLDLHNKRLGAFRAGVDGVFAAAIIEIKRLAVAG